MDAVYGVEKIFFHPVDKICGRCLFFSIGKNVFYLFCRAHQYFKRAFDKAARFAHGLDIGRIRFHPYLNKPFHHPIHGKMPKRFMNTMTLGGLQRIKIKAQFMVGDFCMFKDFGGLDQHIFQNRGQQFESYGAGIDGCKGIHKRRIFFTDGPQHHEFLAGRHGIILIRTINTQHITRGVGCRISCRQRSLRALGPLRPKSWDKHDKSKSIFECRCR